jgi:predicted membrane-bound mannosyltransferase
MVAGCGVATLYAWLRRWYWQVPGMLLCSLLLWPLAAQNRRANGLYAADPRNPYAYVHTLPDARRLAQRIDAVAACGSAAASSMVDIAVFSSAEDAWPLPWYLRRHDAVGYWSELLPELVAARPRFIVCSPAYDDDVDEQIGGGYQRELYGWRPNCFMVLRVRRDIWDHWLARQLNE